MPAGEGPPVHPFSGKSARTAGLPDVVNRTSKRTCRSRLGARSPSTCALNQRAGWRCRVVRRLGVVVDFRYQARERLQITDHQRRAGALDDACFL